MALQPGQVVAVDVAEEASQRRTAPSMTAKEVNCHLVSYCIDERRSIHTTNVRELRHESVEGRHDGLTAR